MQLNSITYKYSLTPLSTPLSTPLDRTEMNRPFITDKVRDLGLNRFIIEPHEIDQLKSTILNIKHKIISYSHKIAWINAICRDYERELWIYQNSRKAEIFKTAGRTIKFELDFFLKFKPNYFMDYQIESLSENNTRKHYVQWLNYRKKQHLKCHLLYKNLKILEQILIRVKNQDERPLHAHYDAPF